MADTNTNGSIVVTYSANSTVLASPLTNHVVSSLACQLPLRTLHWRPSPKSFGIASGSTIRTIQTLQVLLKPLTDEIKRWRGDLGYLESPGSAGLLDRPFVHLYLVVCDDNEHYRTTVRNEIRSWISSLSFFHSNPSQAASSTGGANRNSFGLGSIRSSTPPVRSDTSNPPTPKGQATPSRSASLPYNATAEPEYIIVVVNPPQGSGISGTPAAGADATAKSGMGRFYSSKTKGNVVEKIKTDFNTSKKEHVVHLTRLPPVPDVPSRPRAHAIDPTIWAELLTRMKEGASTTFSSTVETQEEEIRRCESTRGQPGWDFCSYFLSKDSLARTLEGIGLRDDAAAQYQDLEAVFVQAMQNGNVSFAPIGGDVQNDDSLPLLDVGKKPYQEMIRKKEISLFDFRCYLFARRASLLGQLGRVAQVMREALIFIGAVRRMLSANSSVSQRLIESWAFSTSLDVVEQCQAWLIERGHVPAGRARLEGRASSPITSSISIDDQLSPVFHSAKAELLDLARRQLDKIGMAVGHLPKVEPFLLAAEDEIFSRRARDLPPLPPDAESKEEPTLQKVSQPELQQAIENRDHFDSHYTCLSERIVSGWLNGGRKRNVLRLRTILAALDFHRERYDKAYTAFLQLSEPYRDQKWEPIEAHLLARQLECHRQLDKPRDRAWISIVMAALRASEGRQLLSTDELDSVAPSPSQMIEKWQDQRFLFQQLREATSSFEKEMPISGHRALSVVPLSQMAELAENEDGSTLQVAVVSSLPFELATEDVRLCLLGKNESMLWFTSGRVTLKPERTVLTLFCATPASGLFAVDVSQVRLTKVIFQYPAPPSQLVQVPKDGNALDVSVDLPREIHLDQPRQVDLEIFAGRNTIKEAEISVVTADGQPIGAHEEAQLATTGEDVKLDMSDLTLKLTGQAAQSRLTIRLPLTATTPDGTLDLIITVNYQNTTRSRRTIKKHARLTVSLPLGVNVQDFFRHDNLFSKFSISAGGASSLRLRPARLVDTEGTEVTGSGSTHHATVTPRQPASYLFRISNPGQKKRLRLYLEYCTLIDESRAAALAVLNEQIDAKNEELAGGSPLRMLLERTLISYIEARLDLPAFSLTGEMRTGPFDVAWWKRERQSWHNASSHLAVSLAKSTLEIVAKDRQAPTCETVWRILSIPVETPSMAAVNAVTMHVLSPGNMSIPGPGYQATIIVGHPVDVRLSIKTTFTWNTESAETEIPFLYDVSADFDKWLVSGSKRDTFQPADGDFEVTVQLVPLKTGSLTLPNVSVRPVTPGINCETYVQNAAQRVQVIPRRWTSTFWVDTEVV